MPRVETYKQGRLSAVRRNDPTPTAFIQKTDTTVAKAVANFAQTTLDEYSNYEESKAEQAMVHFKKEQNKLLFLNEDAYFNTKGENAYNGEEGVNKSLEKMRGQFANDLNPLAREMFMKGSQVHLDNSKLKINSHAQKGLDVFDSQTRQAVIENTFETGSLYWNDPDQVTQQNTIGRLAIINKAEKDGTGEEALREDLEGYDSIYYSSIIKAAADKDLTASNALMEQFDSKFESTEDKKKVQDYIDSVQKKTDMKNESFEVLSRATEIRNASGKDLRFGMNLIEDVDPKYQAKVRREYFSQVASYNRVEANENKQTINDAQKFVNKGQSLDQWIALGDNFEKYQRLSEPGKNSLSKENKIVTPAELQIELATAKANNDKDTVRNLVEQFGDNLSVKDNKTYQVFLNTDEKYKSLSTSTPMVKSVTNTFKGDDKYKKRNAFNDALLNWSLEYYDEFKKNPEPNVVRQQLQVMMTSTPTAWYNPSSNPDFYKTDTYIADSLKINSMSQMDKIIPITEQTDVKVREQQINNFKDVVGRYPSTNDFKQYQESYSFIQEQNGTSLDPDAFISSFLVKYGRFPTKSDLTKVEE